MKFGIGCCIWWTAHWNLKNNSLSTDDSDSQMGQQCQTPNKTIDINDQVRFVFLPIYP